MAMKSYKDISKEYKLQADTEKLTAANLWEAAHRGLIIRQTEAMEKMAENYQHLLDELERYKLAYRQYKNKAENLEQELRQQKSVASRYRNQRDRIKEQMTENAIAL